MKKIKLFSLILCISLLLAGCSSAGNESSPSDSSENISSQEESSPSSQVQNNTQSAPMHSPGSDTDAPIPQYIADLFLAYEDIEKNSDLDIAMRSYQIHEEKNTLEFSISSRKEENHWDTFYFHRNESGGAELSYSIVLNPKYPDYFRDVLQTVLIQTGGENQGDLAQKVQSLINSYSSAKPSSIIKSGDFYIFLEPRTILSKTQPDLNVCHRDEVFPKAQPGDYLPIDYEAASAELNQGSKFVLEATVESNIGFVQYNVLYNVRDAQGNPYSLLNSLSQTPIEYEVGKTYRFYCTLTKTDSYSPTLRIETVENIDGSSVIW